MQHTVVQLARWAGPATIDSDSAVESRKLFNLLLLSITQDSFCERDVDKIIKTFANSQQWKQFFYVISVQ